jgi:hypothetical protein
MHDRDLRPLARSQESVVVRAQPRVLPDGDQCRHPESMAQARISEREAPRAGERALARLPQTRHYTDIAGERAGIAKAARVAQLGDQACAVRAPIPSIVVRSLPTS